jgi:fibronectin-binding autotransporter adhesin
MKNIVLKMGVFVACLLGALAPVSATTNTDGGDWFDSGKWSEGIPSALDTAVIIGATVEVKLPGAAAFDLLLDGSLGVHNDPLTPGLTGSLGVGRAFVVGYAGKGDVTVSDGGRVSSRFVYISQYPGSSGSVTINGSTGVVPGGAEWTCTDSFFVGATGASPGGNAFLNLLKGGILRSRDGWVGNGTSAGTATVNNAAWNMSNLLTVGAGGMGTLYVQNRGTVTDLTGVVGTTASVPSAVGKVDIENATWTNTGDFHVGSSGVGILAMRQGAAVSGVSGYIGSESDGIGTADLDNSTWTTAQLVVGLNGSGTLNIHDGSTVTNGVGIIGRYDRSNGSARVDNATWTNSGDLIVASGVTGLPGTHANGTLVVQNGGKVSSVNGSIASWTGTTGTAVVKGVHANGTPSSWTMVGKLLVGDRGVGELDIENGGIVRSLSTYVSYSAGPTGTLNVRGTSVARGVLETGQISNGTGAGPGTGSITIDGGILRATTNQAEFLRNFHAVGVIINSGGAFIDSNTHNIGISTPLQGPGGLTKVGIGTLDLTGTNIYAGLTAVDEGKLLANGSIAGDALVNSGATLGGTGKIFGAVTVAPGGILSPGNSPGTLTVGPLTLNPLAALTVELGAVSDLLVVNGDLTLAGILNLVGDPAFFAAGSLPSFISYTGALTNNGLVIGSVPAGLSASDFALDFSTPGVVGVSNVPEPISAALLALGALLLGKQRTPIRSTNPQVGPRLP